MFCTTNGEDDYYDGGFDSDENDGDGKIMVLAVLMRGDEACELPLPSVTSSIYHQFHIIILLLLLSSPRAKRGPERPAR